MTREDRFSSPTDGVPNDYNKFTEEEAYKRYAENLKMFPIDDTPREYDPYLDLTRRSKKLLKIVKPAIKEKQEDLENYNLKPFGEKRTYPQNWEAYDKAKTNQDILFKKLLQELLFLGAKDDNSGKRGRVGYSIKDKLFYLLYLFLQI